MTVQYFGGAGIADRPGPRNLSGQTGSESRRGTFAEVELGMENGNCRARWPSGVALLAALPHLALCVAAVVLAVVPATPAYGSKFPVVIDAPPLGVDEDELDCLAEAVYFEARGEGAHGQRAVAEVILNRRADPAFPDNVCAVVHQGFNPANPELHQCQFSYFCDGLPEAIGDRERLARIRAMAWNMLRGEKSNLAQGATHYHADYVSPTWTRNLVRVARVDQHIFYARP